MLLKFRLQNSRSVRDIQELTLLSGPDGGFGVPLRSGCSGAPGPSHSSVAQGSAGSSRTAGSSSSDNTAGALRVSPLCGVFGPTAAGKSTILRALSTMRSLAVSGSDVHDATQRFEPFQLDPAARLLPTRFEIEFLLDGVRYVYGCAYKRDEIAGEWLHATDRDRRRVWFERDRTGIRCLPEARLDHLAAACPSAVTLLSLGADVEHPWLAPIAAWLFGIRTVRLAPGTRLAGGLAHLSDRWSEQLTLLVSHADLGVVGVERDLLRLVHAGRSGSVPLGGWAESDGTIAWLDLLAALLPMLERGGVLLVDDLDAAVHPDLAAEALRLLRDRDLNPARAQLVFTARTPFGPGSDGLPVLDPEQIWYVAKDSDGATVLSRAPSATQLGPGDLARELWLARQPK
ncbi:AAA family ATPase [Dactylosporangium sp. CA-152071]|uniref:AAA family ATPase n=1 Tax=Dactylosporangium sp. CA-152071 TaxID=3239933 RepID=UPI003D8B8AB0